MNIAETHKLISRMCRDLATIARTKTLKWVAGAEFMDKATKLVATVVI